jgi:hypothetical protein
MTEHQPGWHPDPGGRHEHRYWDGSRWTDDVADAGVTTRDPLGAPGPTDPTVVSSSDPTASMPTAGFGTPPAWDPASGPGDPVGGDRPGTKRGLVLGVAALVAVALVVAGVLFLGGDDDGDGILAADRSELDDDGPFGDLDGPFDDFDDVDDFDDFDDLGGLDGLGLGGFDGTDIDPADMIGSVARIYEDALGLSSAQARCLAEELLGAFDAFDDADGLDDADAFGSAFEAFDSCGISLADLDE